LEGINTIDASEVLTVLAIAVGVSLLLAVLVGVWVFTRIRRINLPPDVDFFTALRHTPLSVVILLDLLDFSLDFLSAPFAWVILDRLGLKALRGVSIVETLIPGTQFLPTMTAAWVLARILRNPPRIPPDVPRLYR
jgi:hypothetical protein